MYRNDCQKQKCEYLRHDRQIRRYTPTKQCSMNINHHYPIKRSDLEVGHINSFKNSPQLINGVVELLRPPSNKSAQQHIGNNHFYKQGNINHCGKKQLINKIEFHNQKYSQNHYKIHTVSNDKSKQKHSQKICDFCHQKGETLIHTSDNLVLCQNCYSERKMEKERKKNQQRKYHQENNQKEKERNEKEKKEKKQEEKKYVEWDEIQQSYLKGQVPQALLCSISQQLMSNPVMITVCGHTFDQKNIKDWLQKQSFCPVCKKKANITHLQKNYALADMIESYKKLKS